MNKKALALMTAATLSLAGLSGCTSLPAGYDKGISQGDVVTQMRDTWAATPAVVQVPSAAGIVIRKHGELPPQQASKRLGFTATPDMTLADMVYLLDLQGYQVASRLSAELAAKPVGFAAFEGTLGALLERISVVADVGYEYRNGLVFITEGNRYTVTLPQHKALLDEVAKALADMGATAVRADLHAGSVSYQATPSVAEQLEAYVQAVAQNAAMVSLQVAVLTVSLNRSHSLGFDWSAFATEYGTRDFKPGEAGGSAETSIKNGALAALSSNGLAYRFVSSSFSLSAALRALSTFGEARTEQNVVLGTLSGLPVKISSGSEIPYVENIGDRVDSNGNVTGGTTTTTTVNSGLTIEVTPQFDAADLSVVTGVKVDLSSLIGFRELSAGKALGTLSRPEMQKLTFENLSRLQAGETIIIGGITYDQISDNYTSFPGLEKAPVGSESKKTNRNAIFIVIRPSVVLFGNAPASASVRTPDSASQTPSPNAETASGSAQEKQ